MKIALVDSDIVSYEQGFASQQTLYHCNGRAYETKKEAEEENGKDAILVPEVIPMHKRAALKMVRERISGILEAVGTNDYECYLTGKDNFRDKVATILKYKGTRSAPRPYHYQNIRNYLVDHWGAKVIHGMEADDMLAIRQTECGDSSVICSRDKDLRQVAGYHYSWAVSRQDEKPVYYIDELTGMYNLAKQMLTGDNTDNILGVVGIGDKKAEKLLDGYEDATDLKRRVLGVYDSVYGAVAGDGGRVHYTGWDGSRQWKTPRELGMENFLLLFMRRYL